MAAVRPGPGLVIGLACAALWLAPAARAAEFGFCEGLSAEERSASGIARLTPAQVSALNALVGRDVTLAREGGVTAFSTAFSARHSAQERAAAGLDGLTDAQRSTLDRLAARAISLGPPPLQPFLYAPPPAPPPPAPRKPWVSALLETQVHGDLSFSFGGGHGFSAYGGSADIYVTDPTGTFTVGVGVGEYRARGWAGPYGLFCPPYAGPFAPGY